MTPGRTKVNVQLAVRNGRGLSELPGLHETNLRRDVGLKIEQIGSEYYFVLIGCDLNLQDDWTAKHDISPFGVFSLVQDCRATWMHKVVNFAEEVLSPRGMRRAFPFKDDWDHASRDDAWLRQICAPLAVAGAKLFHSLFRSGADPRMDRLAAKLRELSRTRELIITITSNDFFIPWGLLYTHPDESDDLAVDGSNFRWEGFWGYRHIIEHNPEYSTLPWDLKPSADGRLVTSFNIDDRIDAQLNVACIQPQRTFFQSLLGWGIIERTKKSEFIGAIASDDFADQIVYFCCHGVGSGDPGRVSAALAQLTLSDDDPITATDIDYHMSGHEFHSHPIVFINACQNGQMTTLFYQTVAKMLLKKGASGLIGAQIDMPAVFAAEFAQRFFSGFFSRRGKNRILIGPLLRSTTRELLQEHKNPLGLAYSLYRGMDCFIAWGDTREPPSPS